MKQFSLIMVLVILSVVANSQNLQLHYDLRSDRNYLTTTVENFVPDAHGSTFFFVDFNYGANGPIEAYWEIARELKNWDNPFSIHFEYNGGLHASELSPDEMLSFPINNAYLLGCTYSWNAEDFSKGLSLSAMYKHIQKKDEPHNFQLTAVWYLHMFNQKLSFTGFADFWKEKNVFYSFNGGGLPDITETSFVFLSEPQLWYNFNKKISLGTEVELSSNFGGLEDFNVFPTIGAKWAFN